MDKEVSVISESNTAGIVDAILEVGRQRAALLEDLRSALQCGNEPKALHLARQLCGLDNEESNRVNSRLN
jgi:hypothetical protein